MCPQRRILYFSLALLTVVSAIAVISIRGWTSASDAPGSPVGPVVKDGLAARSTQPGSATSPNLLANLQQVTETVLKTLPAGGTVKAPDYKRRFGSDAETLLKTLDVLEVSRRGNRIELVRGAKSKHRLSDADVTLLVHVSFEAKKTATGVDLTEVEGVVVDAGAAIPNLDLKEAQITTDAAGNSTIVMKMEMSWLLPYVTHTVTYGPDGEPIPDN